MRNPVSKRYARAFLELGVANGSYSTLQKQLREFADAFGESRDLQNVVLNPGVRVDERRNIVRAIGQKQGWDTMMLNLTLLLIDKDRIALVQDIADVFDAMVDEHDGNVRATVTSARSLNPTQVGEIKTAIAKMTGKNVLLETSVDEALLGGVVTRVGGKVFDGSVRTQLQTLKDSILQDV